MPRSGNRERASKAMVLTTACVVVAALYLAQDVLIPVALAMLITFLLAPLVRYLERRNVPRIGAVLAVVLTGFLLFGLLGWVVVGQVMDLAGSIDQYKGNIVAKLEGIQSKGGLWTKVSNTTAEITKDLDKPTTRSATAPTTASVAAAVLTARDPEPHTITEATKSEMPNPATQPTRENPLPVAIVEPPASPTQTLSKYVGFALGPLGTAGIVVVFVIFMLLSREDLRDRMIRLIGYGQMHVTMRALDDAATRISKYLTAQAIVNGTYGFAIAIGLLLIGHFFGDHPFPNVVLWGLLCAVLRFVPYIGPWVASAFPLAVGFAVYPGWGVLLGVITVFLVIELLSNNFMEPWLYGSSTGMSTVAILVAAVFWTWLWGPIGLLLSTPMTVCLVVMGKYVPQMRFLDVLLGDTPVLEPHERVYQRLLAMDQEEAAELAEEYLAKMPMEDVYDKVLMPALAMAEQDRHRGRLDDARQDFIREAMRDMVEDIAEQNRVKMVRAQAAQAEASAKGNTAAAVSATPAAERSIEAIEREKATTLPKGAEVSVVLLPSHDPADEIVCNMVANVLDVRGYRAKVVSVTALASEMVHTVDEEQADMVIVSALPPAAVTHARYLCKRLHSKFPEIETLVGLWMWKGDAQKAKSRIACTRAVRLVTSLCQCLDEVHQASLHLIVKKSPA